MKKNLYLIGVIVLLYFCIAFIDLEINPFMWVLGTRILFSVGVGIVVLICILSRTTPDRINKQELDKIVEKVFKESSLTAKLEFRETFREEFDALVAKRNDENDDWVY